MLSGRTCRKNHRNIRVIRSGFKAQNKRDCGNYGLSDLHVFLFEPVVIVLAVQTQI